MQQDIVGQVLGATGKPTRNGGTIYKVAFSDGQEYGTFDGELAQKAASLVGQQVSARVEVVQKGQYTNYNFIDVAPQGQLAPGAVPLGGTVIPQAPQATPSAIGAAPAGVTMLPAGNAEKDAQIAKGVAVKVAGGIVSGLFSSAGPEAVDEALDCFDTVGKHVLGVLTGTASTPQAEQAVVPAEQTPEAVAAAVNEAAGTEVVAAGVTPEW